MKRIVIFASGTGTNAENIITFFRHRKNASVVLVLSNNPNAKIIERCKKLNISAITFNKSAFFDAYHVFHLLKSVEPDLIVLAGFLWKFPEFILNQFRKKVINIHPALLPKYGGKGMYGMHVHKAVMANNEKETGITIHYVNECYDEGEIIFQTKCNVDVTDSPEVVASKVHDLEMEYFPKVINDLLE